MMVCAMAWASMREHWLRCDTRLQAGHLGPHVKERALSEAAEGVEEEDEGEALRGGGGGGRDRKREPVEG